MDKKATSSAHTPGPWTVSQTRMQYLIDAPDYSVGGIPKYVAATPGMNGQAKANARLIATAPDLLRIAESAVVAFEERISCLKDELLEDFCDADDINDQIGNYRWLLNQHRKVIDQAYGKAS